VTTPSLYKPRAPLRPPPVPPRVVRSRAFDEVRAAAVLDLLEPYLFDHAGFIELIRDELRSPVSRPRIIEFGCGTGRLTVPALTTRPDAVYHGFDRSEARLAITSCKLGGQGLLRGATLTAPFELDRASIGEALQGLRADFLLLPRFLQTVPLCATEGGGLHRTAFLAFCQQLVKPGGRMLIIEEVYGEDAAEHACLSRAALEAFRARLTADLPRVRHGLQGLDPQLAARLGLLPGDPLLLGELRSRAGPAGAGTQMLPLSAWHRMFEHLGFTYRTLRLESQPQLCLFTVRC